MFFQMNPENIPCLLKSIILSKHVFSPFLLAESQPCDLLKTAYKRRCNHAFVRKLTDDTLELSERAKNIKRFSRWNDKTVIKLGYRKISWFASVSQFIYLSQPLASANNWSAPTTDKSRYLLKPVQYSS